MITLVTDPNDPSKLILTATVSMYLDRLMVETLNDAIAEQIAAQARKDIRSNPEVKKKIAEAATAMLLQKLGVEPEEKPDVKQP